MTIDETAKQVAASVLVDPYHAQERIAAALREVLEKAVIVAENAKMSDLVRTAERPTAWYASAMIAMHIERLKESKP